MTADYGLHLAVAWMHNPDSDADYDTQLLRLLAAVGGQLADSADPGLADLGTLLTEITAVELTARGGVS